MPHEPDIFDYLDFRQFVREKMKFEKELKSNRNIGSLAKKIGLDRTFIHHVLSGRRKLPQKHIVKLSKCLQLSLWESRYFEALVQWNQCEEEERRPLLWEKVAKIRPAKDMKWIHEFAPTLEDKWYFLSLIEVTRLSDFQPDIEWLRKKLPESIDPQEALELLYSLRDLGYFRVMDGKWIPAETTMLNSAGKLPLEFINRYHKKHMELAAQKLEGTDPDFREYSSMCLALNENQIQLLRSKLQEFRKDILESFGQNTANNEVFHLNIQFFPFTQNTTFQKKG